QDTITLRHLPFAGMRTYLHVPGPDASESNKVWAPAGSAFTTEMEGLIVEALRSCHTIQAVAKLTHITSAEAREISERTGVAPEYHEPNIPAAAPAAAVVQPEQVATHSYELGQATNLPAETDEAWQRLINGEIPIQSSSVALQMLIQRIRQNIMASPTEVTRLASSKLLRQYFVKNQSQHQAEINMLSGGAVPMMAAAQAVASASGLPGDGDLCWQRIINGSLKIDTSEVGLQMMMQRVRLSVERNPSEDSRIAGSRILHQYFSKHQARLKTEIQQLGGSVTPISSAIAGQVLAPPAVSSPVWQEIISGQKTVETGAVGLQMMMERVRLSVERNPSEATQKAGIKMLYQFFAKHQNRLQTEIRQLGGAAATGQTLGVPAVSAPIWQAIITGQKTVDTSAVGLQMMMERVRLSVERNPSENSQKAGIKILHQFFTKHQSRLQAEIQQLGGTAATGQAPGVPAVSSPIWQAIITGQKTVDTSAVGLQMMMERVRLSVERNPSEASQKAGIKILHQFFTKHQSRLQSEVQQLGGTAASASITQTVSVPADTHPSWQRLINGELEIKTDVVALKMMLERVRISIENNPSDASRIAGAKILRQYFLKHQSKHQAELDQLLAA
ncbi:MAG: hypothetical protein DRQ48_10240, partial [Gammaproteobacteria bacterium]